MKKNGINIIISPAKKMNVNNDDIVYKSLPYYLDKTKDILNFLRSLSFNELKSLLECNDSISTLNYERYRDMDLYSNLTAAILSYEGIQYNYMSPNTFSTKEFDYISNNLFILSGFYGILKPFDGIVPYRLEMQSKLTISKTKGLYNYWEKDIYNLLTKENKPILNLASKEYSKSVEKYLKDSDTYITCIFGQLKDNKVKVTSTESKMARGLMTRYMAENNITSIEAIKDFTDMSFSFCENRSTENTLVFLK
ncbi:MAG: peroxide stress protein YaaA [Clostridium sp.]